MDLTQNVPENAHTNNKQSKEPNNKELKTSLTKNFRVLPLYESALLDYTFSRNHSLVSNEILRCRWVEYQKEHVIQKPAPFVFPNTNDYHFYNYDTCYKPELSINLRPDHRYVLKHGPGVDNYGEMPIPSDVGFRKTGLMVDPKRKKGKKYDL